jgi:hypothetical protein
MDGEEMDEREFDQILKSFEELPSIPNAREMMVQAISKATTPPSKQKMFWGIPRQKIEQDY